MSPGDRFILLITLLGLIWGSIATWVGFSWRRRVHKDDDWRAFVSARLITLGTEDMRQSAWPDRMDRLESALVTLSKVVTEQGLQQARHEGWHERQGTGPMMG